MLSLSNLFEPLTGDLGVGMVGGFIVGYAAKKMARVMAVVLGIGFVVLQFLAYERLIAIDYPALREQVLTLVGPVQEALRLMADMAGHIPLGAGLAFGFFLGLNKG